MEFERNLCGIKRHAIEFDYENIFFARKRGCFVKNVFLIKPEALSMERGREREGNRSDHHLSWRIVNSVIAHAYQIVHDVP